MKDNGSLPVSERHVVDLWEKQRFPQSALDSLGLRVVFRGFPSDAGGPDFQEVILQAGKRLLCGDVEFHLRSSDWYRHQHHKNRRYNNVVLHVVWISDIARVEREDGYDVPTLALSGCVDSAEAHAYQVPLLPTCVSQIAQKSSSEVATAVGKAGTTRWAERLSFFASEMESLVPDQVAYQHVLEAMGYASNRQSFRQLAEVMPYRYLASFPTREWAGLLAHVAGFSDLPSTVVPVRLDPTNWRIARIRPNNHPARRLAAFVVLLEKLYPSPAESLRDIVMKAVGPIDLRNALITRCEGGIIGAGRADELAVSVVLPFVAAMPGCAERCFAIYERYPSPPATRWTRYMTGILEDAGHPFRPRTAVEHQGLHFLYHRACRNSNRAACTLCASVDGNEPLATDDR